MAQRRHKVTAEITAEDQASRILKQIANEGLGILGIQTAHLVKQLVETTAEMTVMGAQSLQLKDNLIAFAGGARQAEEYLEALNAGAMNTIDRMTATQYASSLLRQGMVTDARDMEMVGAIVSRLGNQTKSLEDRFRQLSLMLANQSTLRLDEFGMSVEKVEARQKELEKQGYSTQEAYKTAVWEEAARQLGVMGDQSETAATKIAQLKADAETAKQVLAEYVAEQTNTITGMVNLTQAAKDLTDWLREVGKAQKEGASHYTAARIHSGELTLETDKLATSITNLAAHVFAGAAAMVEYARTDGDATKSRAVFNLTLMEGLGIIEDGNVSLQMHNQYMAAIEGSYQSASAAVRQFTMSAQEASMVMAGLQMESRVADMRASMNRRTQDAEQQHLDRLADITRSGMQSQEEIVRASYQRQMDALNAHMQAELNALAARAQARDDARRMEDIEAQHQERLAQINEQYIENERDLEDKRYQEVIDHLDEEQRKRLEALRREYGKETDFDSQKESLEGEHKRRMMGLYSESARKKEEERYAAALKELEYAQKEKDILDEFADKKEDAEEEHRENLEEIKERDRQKEIERENQRYETEKQKEAQRIAERRADAGARAAIEAKYAAEREALEAQLAADLDAIREAETAAAIAEENRRYAQQKADFAQQRADMEEDVGLMYANWQLQQITFWENAKIITAQQAAQMRSDIVSEFTEMATKAVTQIQSIITAMTTLLNMPTYAGGPDWEMPGPNPPGKQSGGPASGWTLVGERGPELLKLPGGSYVYDHMRSLEMLRYQREILRREEEENRRYAQERAEMEARRRGTGFIPFDPRDRRRGTGFDPRKGEGGEWGQPVIIIHNHFGPGSIRSDRDIMKMVEEQEAALRRRGITKGVH